MYSVPELSNLLEVSIWARSLTFAKQYTEPKVSYSHISSSNQRIGASFPITWKQEMHPNIVKDTSTEIQNPKIWAFSDSQ